MTNPMHTPRAPRIPTLREEAIATATAQWLAADLPATADLREDDRPAPSVTDTPYR